MNLALQFCLSLATLIAAPALADMFSDAQKKAPSSTCARIEQMCTAAGYTRGQAKKDLDNDCFAPTINGQKVEGVNVDAKMAEECLGSLPKKPAKSAPHH